MVTFDFKKCFIEYPTNRDEKGNTLSPVVEGVYVSLKSEWKKYCLRTDKSVQKKSDLYSLY